MNAAAAQRKQARIRVVVGKAVQAFAFPEMAQRLVEPEIQLVLPRDRLAALRVQMFHRLKLRERLQIARRIQQRLAQLKTGD